MIDTAAPPFKYILPRYISHGFFNCILQTQNCSSEIFAMISEMHKKRKVLENVVQCSRRLSNLLTYYTNKSMEKYE